MKIIYTVILLVSAMGAVGIFLRLHKQLAPAFHLDRFRVGGLIMLPMLGFLVVAYAPAPIISGALLLTALGWWDDQRGVSRPMGLATTLLAVSIGLVGLPLPVMALPAPLPAVLLAAWGLWWLFTFSAARLPRSLTRCFMLVAFALLPLVLASLIHPSLRNLALDIAIIDSVFFGALLMITPQHQAVLALRLPLTFLLGYAILHTLLAGAWPFALTSLAILLVALLWGRPQKQPGGYQVQTFQ